MTKLIFERTKPCAELLEPEMKTDLIGDVSDQTENEEDIHTFQRTVFQRKFSCPALVFFRDNCDSEPRDHFVRERSRVHILMIE